MKQFLTACALILGFGVAAFGGEAAPVIDVWPGAPLGETRKFEEEKIETNKNHVAILHNVFKPTLTIYHAPKDHDTGASVIVCPGGGYGILAWDLEGTEVAEWLNSAGVTGIVLRYRVPARRTGELHGFIPLMDAQRAISLVRSKAGELGIDPKRIGILGFSAGGNLAALSCTNFATRSYDAIDDVDKVSCRPDFGVLIYPAYLLVEKPKAEKPKGNKAAAAAVPATNPSPETPDQLSPLLPISAQTPPIFFAHANDDGVPPAGSAIMYLALKRAGVKAELHIYTFGGHGFGLRPTTRPCSTWPKRCEEWMHCIGLLGPVKAK